MQKAVLKYVGTFIVVSALMISGYFGCQKKVEQLGNLWTVPGCVYHMKII